MSDEAQNTKNTLLTKLSQLNKVIEYLSFHLEEHIFQAETLRRRYETAEDEILQNTEKRMSALPGSFELQASLVESVQKSFDQQVTEMKSELSRAKQSVILQVTHAHKRLKHAIHTSKKEISNLEASIADQVAFLSNDANFKPDTISEKEAQANAEFQEAIRIHDEESARKEKLLEEQTKNREAELTSDYQDILASIRRKMKPSKSFLAHFEQRNLDLRARTKSLEGEGQYCLMEIKRTSPVQFVQMKKQAKKMTDEMKQMNAEILAVKHKFDEKAAIENKKFEETIKSLTEQKNNNARKHQLQIVELRDELKEYDPVEKVKRETEAERETITAKLSKMETDVKLYKDFAQVNQKNLAAASQYEEELEQIRQKVAAECLMEQRTLRTLVNAAKELDDSAKLLKKLKIPRPQEPITIQVPPSFEKEKTELAEMQQLRYNKGCKKKKSEIAELQKELDAQLEEQKKSCDVRTREVVGEVETDVPEDAFSKRMNEQYEAMLHELEAEYNGIEEFVKPEEIDIEPVRERLAKVKEDVARKREEVNESFQRMIKEEEDRFNRREVTDTVAESKSLIEEQNRKNEKVLTDLDIELATLEGDWRKLSESRDRSLVNSANDYLKSMRQTARQNARERREIREQINEANEKNTTILEQHINEHHEAAAAHASQMEELRLAIREIHKKANEEELAMVKSYQAKKNALIQQNKVEFERVNREMTTLRQDMEKGDQNLNWLLKEDQLKYEAIFNTMESEIAMHKRKAENANDFAMKIERLTAARDRAKSRFEEAGARDKERIEIDTLEGLMAQRNLELSKLRRELLRAKKSDKEKPMSRTLEFAKTGRQDQSSTQPRLPRLRRSTLH